MPPPVELTLDDLRAVTAYAAACARPVLALADRPEAAEAVEAAEAFAGGGPRGRALRDTAWAAHRAARDLRDAGEPAAAEAARAAGHAAGAAYLHPLAKDTQVGHVLGAAAHGAAALELAGHDPADHLARCRDLAAPPVVAVLRRYPPAPAGHGRAGELMRALDTMLRAGRAAP